MQESKHQFLTDFKHLAEAFNQKDDASCEFVRFDLPGYGNSAPLHPSLLPTADNYAETLLKAIKEADILRNRKAIVMGHSLGNDGCKNELILSW